MRILGLRPDADELLAEPGYASLLFAFAVDAVGRLAEPGHASLIVAFAYNPALIFPTFLRIKLLATVGHRCGTSNLSTERVEFCR